MTKLNPDIGKLILRLTGGGLMIFHGIHKLLNGHDFIKQVLGEAGLPETIWIGTPIGEVLAPICLILGIFTRTSAALISFTMFMSIYLVHGWSGLQLNPDYGSVNAELNLLYLFIGLSIYFLGSGKFAVSQILFPKNSGLKKY